MNRTTHIVVLAFAVCGTLGAQAAPKIDVMRQLLGSEGLELHLRDLAPVADRILEERRQEPFEPTEPAGRVGRFERFDAESPAAVSDARDNLMGSLANSARAFVQPPLAAGQGIELVAGRWLVAVLAADQQAWVDRHLQLQMAFAPQQVAFDSQIYWVDSAIRGAHEIPRETVTIDEAQAKVFLRRLADAQGGVEMVNAPAMLAHPTQRLSVSIIEQISYVRDFAVQAAAGNVLADPIVDVVSDGMIFDVTATPLEGERFGVIGTLHLVDVMRPIPQKNVDLLPGQSVTIQVPAVREFEVALAVEIADGGFAIVPGPSFEGRELVLVLHLRGGEVGRGPK